jgi:hypothetical protein
VAKLDVNQIDKNRRTMDDSTIESPYVPSLSDADSDFQERLYGSNMPVDKVGFMPPNEKNRKG